jgi:hypothetical protein
MSCNCADEQECKSSPLHGGWSMVANRRQPCTFGKGIPASAKPKVRNNRMNHSLPTNATAAPKKRGQAHCTATLCNACNGATMDPTNRWERRNEGVDRSFRAGRSGGQTVNGPVATECGTGTSWHRLARRLGRWVGARWQFQNTLPTRSWIVAASLARLCASSADPNGNVPTRHASCQQTTIGPMSADLSSLTLSSDPRICLGHNTEQT